MNTPNELARLNDAVEAAERAHAAAKKIIADSRARRRELLSDCLKAEQALVASEAALHEYLCSNGELQRLVSEHLKTYSGSSFNIRDLKPEQIPNSLSRFLAYEISEDAALAELNGFFSNELTEGNLRSLKNALFETEEWNNILRGMKPHDENIRVAYTNLTKNRGALHDLIAEIDQYTATEQAALTKAQAARATYLEAEAAAKAAAEAARLAAEAELAAKAGVSPFSRLKALLPTWLGGKPSVAGIPTVPAIEPVPPAPVPTIPEPAPVPPAGPIPTPGPVAEKPPGVFKKMWNKLRGKAEPLPAAPLPSTIADVASELYVPKPEIAEHFYKNPDFANSFCRHVVNHIEAELRANPEAASTPIARDAVISHAAFLHVAEQLRDAKDHYEFYLPDEFTDKFGIRKLSEESFLSLRNKIRSLALWDILDPRSALPEPAMAPTTIVHSASYETRPYYPSYSSTVENAGRHNVKAALAMAAAAAATGWIAYESSRDHDRANNGLVKL